MSTVNYCSKCGKQVTPNARFCSSCGAAIQTAQTPVQGVPPTQVTPFAPEEHYPPPQGIAPTQVAPPSAECPAYPPSVSTPPARVSGWVWGLGAGIGCMLLLVVAGVLVFFLWRGNDNPISLLPATATPTHKPTTTRSPTSTALIIQATSAPQVIALTGRQEQSPERIFDDFSSKALGWIEDQTKVGWAAYQDDGYVIEVNVANKGIYSAVPLATLPNHIEFKARESSGQGGGFYAVRCLAQNQDHFYEVWIDPSQQSYRLMQFAGAASTTLVDWSRSSSFAPAGETDAVIVDCTPGMISLTINSQNLFEQMVQAQNGKMYLVVKTYTEMSAPVQIWFDDVEAWKQMQ